MQKKKNSRIRSNFLTLDCQWIVIVCQVIMPKTSIVLSIHMHDIEIVMDMDKSPYHTEDQLVGGFFFRIFHSYLLFVG